MRKVQVIVFTPEKEILLLKMVDQRGGYWQPITGSVESGEKYIEAALRELKEETGIEPVPGYMIDPDYEFEFRARGNTFTEKVFGYGCPEKISIDLSSEHSEYKWVNRKEAIEMIYWESNREALRKLLDEI